MAREHEVAFLRLRHLADHENGLLVDVPGLQDQTPHRQGPPGL
ncbi:hypothetical protein [Streptomyces liliiviolaceus]|nr:hypothetical protein [Streptomyces liliiviolaceus]